MKTLTTLLLGLTMVPSVAMAQEDAPPEDEQLPYADLLDEEARARIEGEWEEWVEQLSPSERELIVQLRAWEDQLDPMVVERLEDELSGEALEHQQDKPFSLRMGFEVGTVTGVRMQAQSERNGIPILGVRLGVHTWRRSELALQPLAMGYLDLPLGELHLIGSYGAASLDGEWQPKGGMGIIWNPWEPLIQMQVGLLWGPGSRSIDVSYAWMW